jgi:hypothetical protein
MSCSEDLIAVMSAVDPEDLKADDLFKEEMSPETVSPCSGET